jgi:archaemetzincin
MADFRPDASWNFVFGQASPGNGSGCTASRATILPSTASHRRVYGALLLRQSCKVLAHETARIFGLAHCIYFSCLMNGSNHLAESDRRSPHLSGLPS